MIGRKESKKRLKMLQFSVDIHICDIYTKKTVFD